jgi:hypothetical protein
LCLSILGSSLNCPLFCFLIEFFFYLPTTDGWFWFLLPTTNGCDGNPLGFSSIYGIMPFITASLLAVSVLLMGRVIFFTHSQLSFKRLCRLCFIFSGKSPFPFPTSNRKNKKKKFLDKLIIGLLSMVPVHIARLVLPTHLAGSLNNHHKDVRRWIQKDDDGSPN